jgi:hypothetical protein
MALTVLELFKRLPRTNCGDCGVASCLAFATRVIKEGEALERCPHLTADACELAEAVQRQQEAGLGRRRESVAIAAEVMHAKVAPLDLAVLAPGLGAAYGEENGRPYLALDYLGQTVKVFKDRVQYPPGAAPDPWDAILLYNYLASGGNQPLEGRWITFQELPNSVSKVKTLARLEEKLAAGFTGRTAELRRLCLKLGGTTPVANESRADVAVIIKPLPRIPMMLLFFSADPEEGFAAQVRLLFDAQVLAYLDLESLLFLVEKLVERLLEAAET